MNKTDIRKTKKTEKTNTNKNHFDFNLLIIVLILLSMGLVMVLSASSPSALRDTGSPYTYSINQLRSAFIGIICMYIFFKIDYRIYKKFYIWIAIISIVILLLVLIPGVGKEINGAKRWINVPLISSMQPSEITKIGVIMFLAAYFSINKEDLTQKKSFWVPAVFLGIIGLILLLIQSHLSAAIIIGLITITIMLIAGTKMRYFLTYGIPAGIAIISVMYQLALKGTMGSYRLKRITAFLDPWADPQNSGWQIIQGLYAVGSGGLTGMGLRK